MELVYSGPAGDRDVDVRVEQPQATVGDLLASLGSEGRAAAGVLVDEVFADADLALSEAGLFAGATLVPARQRGATMPAQTPSALLAVIGGHAAGLTFPLSAGEYVVGRNTDCDIVLDHPTVSARHCRLSVSDEGGVNLVNLSERGGIWVEDHWAAPGEAVQDGQLMEIGDVQLLVRPVRTHDRPLGMDPFRHTDSLGHFSFNRPPRVVGPPPPEPLSVPSEPTGADKPVFNVTSMLSPLVMGGLMVVVMKNPLYALMTLLSPVMMLGNWYESRRRSSRSLRRETRTFASELETFRGEVRDCRDAEILRRRSAQPDLGEVMRRADLPSVRLWERRGADDDFLVVGVGLGDLAWQPAVHKPSGKIPDDVKSVMQEYASLSAVPIPVSLREGGVLGIVGEREGALALARAVMCQLAVHQGPADLSLAVLAPGRGEDWDWSKWLPHTRDTNGGDGRFLAASEVRAEEVLKDLTSGANPVKVLLIDGPQLLEGRSSLARRMLRGEYGPAAGVVLAESADRLPAFCTAIVTVGAPGGHDDLQLPQQGETVTKFLAAGLSEEASRRCARRLARFEDPELHVAGSGLPASVRLLPLLELPSLAGEAILERWRRSASGSGVSGPVGVSEAGPLTLDLVEDGPHGLIGGTPGWGKSELLLTMVLSLAANAGPDQVTFGLFDFKGDALAKPLAGLPHVVGSATNLDVQDAIRSLRCMEAELVRRQLAFREAGATEWRQYRELHLARPATVPPIPRLVVIIDEFSRLVQDLPDFVDSLEGIARQGRSLGVHLILADQTPTKVVREKMRSNMLLKIALRVADDAESTEIVGIRDAARISHKGRAYVRTALNEPTAVQVALSTSVSSGEVLRALTVNRFEFDQTPEAEEIELEAKGTRSDLDQLREAIQGAFDLSGLEEPFRPWPDPLPDELDLNALSPVGHSRGGKAKTGFALVDDPDGQRQFPYAWDMGTGNIVLYGALGSGTTTALASLALSLAGAHSPDDMNLYVMDFGGGQLSALSELPHTGGVIGAAERDRQVRLLRDLRKELERRRAMNPTERAQEPAVVVLIDNYLAFMAEYEGLTGIEILDGMTRLYAEGPEAGIHFGVSVDRPGGLPSALANVTPHKLLFGFADPNDYTLFGIQRRQMPRFVPGRMLVAATGQTAQVGRPGPTLTEAVLRVAKATPPGQRPARPVRTLPESVGLEEVLAAGAVDEDQWFVPVGIGDNDLAPAGFLLFDGEHAVVSGPARSGKTTALCVIARVLAACPDTPRIVAVTPRRSALRSLAGLDGLFTDGSSLADLASLLGDGTATVLLVDDAEMVDDADMTISNLLAKRLPSLHIIAAGRADSLRTAYGHWTQKVRQSKNGLLLAPNLDLDGELVGAVLPRRQRLPARAGLGFLAQGGEVELLQVANPH